MWANLNTRRGGVQFSFCGPDGDRRIFAARSGPGAKGNDTTEGQQREIDGSHSTTNYIVLLDPFQSDAFDSPEMWVVCEAGNLEHSGR